jgi:hypothetical protein
MEFQTIIYCDEFSKNHLLLSYPETQNRKYVLRPFTSFVTSKWDWTFDESIDPEIHRSNLDTNDSDNEVKLGSNRDTNDGETKDCNSFTKRSEGKLKLQHKSKLYQIWNEKIFMIVDAIKTNFYNTYTFVWVDIGSFRDKNVLFLFEGFPDNRYFQHDKVSFLQIADFTIKERDNIDDFDNRFLTTNRIGGGIFGGGIHALLQFSDIYFKIISEAKNKKVFAGKDQTLYCFAILRHPHLFNLIKQYRSIFIQVHTPESYYTYDFWMSLHLIWSSHCVNATIHL